jgi:Lrp/AsnC family leucine-responsive transcriptional regulator
MDEMDLKILKLLEKNGRMSHEDIGKNLNLSRPAIHQRISKLEQNNIIKGYSADIDWSRTGQVIRALIFINVQTKNFNAIMGSITSIEIEGLKIEQCFRITGQWCIMLKIRASLPEQITELHDAMLKIDGMLDTFTMLILSEAD